MNTWTPGESHPWSQRMYSPPLPPVRPEGVPVDAPLTPGEQVAARILARENLPLRPPGEAGTWRDGGPSWPGY